MPSSRISISDELARVIFCPPHTVRDHHKQAITGGDILAVLLLLATMVLLGFAVGAECAAPQ